MERTKIGMNRTGMKTSPAESARMLEVPGLTRPSMSGDARLIADTREELAAEVDPMGTMPPPGSMREAATTAMKLLTGKKAPVFIDKLGERLAFERSGVRLYDAALSKFEAYGSWPGGPKRADLERIREEELSHFHLLQQVMVELGADPTAVTPSANVHAVASLGILQVCTDPRSNLQQTLEAISIAELADNDCWENLVDLARSMGRDELADRFAEAVDAERDHLRNVRRWLGAALSEDGTGKLAKSFSERAMKRDAAVAERSTGAERGQRASSRMIAKRGVTTVRAGSKKTTGRITRKAAAARTVRNTPKKKR